jgi:hypothetical protein
MLYRQYAPITSRILLLHTIVHFLLVATENRPILCKSENKKLLKVITAKSFGTLYLDLCLLRLFEVIFIKHPVRGTAPCMYPCRVLSLSFDRDIFTRALMCKHFLSVGSPTPLCVPTHLLHVKSFEQVPWY